MSEVNVGQMETVERAKIHSYKDLIVWQKSMDLVTAIYRLTEDFPEAEKNGLTAQIRVAATAVPTNIADGWGRKSSRHYSEAAGCARGALCELETLLLIADALGYFTTLDTYTNDITQISKMLNGLIKSITTKTEHASEL